VVLLFDVVLVFTVVDVLELFVLVDVVLVLILVVVVPLPLPPLGFVLEKHPVP
jgi:hypothetical protein